MERLNQIKLLRLVVGVAWLLAGCGGQQPAPTKVVETPSIDGPKTVAPSPEQPGEAINTVESGAGTPISELTNTPKPINSPQPPADTVTPAPTPVSSPTSSPIVEDISFETECPNNNGEGARTRGLTVSPPVTSPDNRLVAYVDNREYESGTSKLYITKADRSDRIEIIPPEPLLVNDPVWSPDSNHIAFSGLALSGPSYGGRIYVVQADGSGLTFLVEYAGLYDTISWSPDSKQIAFTDAYVCQACVCHGNPPLVYTDEGLRCGSPTGEIVEDRTGLECEGSPSHSTFPCFYEIRVVEVENPTPAQFVTNGCNPVWRSPSLTPQPPSPLPSKFHFISLSEVANASIQEGYSSPPLGQLELEGIPFNLPAGPNSVTTQAEPIPDFPTTVRLTTELYGPEAVYLLITGGNIFSGFFDKQIGTVRFYFAKNRPYDVPLIAGQNIREWKILDEVTVSLASSPQVREVWRTESTHDGTAIIDLLTIDLPNDYRSDYLMAIEVVDNSTDTVGSMDPAINLLGVTVLGH